MDDKNDIQQKRLKWIEKWMSQYYPNHNIIIAYDLDGKPFLVNKVKNRSWSGKPWLFEAPWENKKK